VIANIDPALHLAEQRLGGNAAPPVRSSGVRSGASLPRFRMATGADFAGAGASPFLGAAACTTTGSSSAIGSFFRGGRF
jgi:hypothetical protein